MKFQLRGTELNNVLRTVIKGFNPKEDNSYVAFKLNPEDSMLTVTARSRASFFEGKIKATSIEVEEDEALVYHLDGVKLKQLVSVLPAAPVNVGFEINDETRSFIIKTAISAYTLPVLSETPLAPAPEVEEYATVDAHDFMKVANDLIKIISTDPSAQEHQISCMHFKLTDNSVRMSATDAYALGSIKVSAEFVDLEETEVKDVLIRHTEVKTLMESFAAGQILTIVGSDDMFGYIDEEGILSLVGKINMVPLDTSQIEASTQDDTTVTIDKGELKSAIETVAKLSQNNDETVDIEFDVEKESISVSNRYGDSIEVPSSEIKLENSGTVSFSTSVFLKSLTPANNGSVRLELGNLGEDAAGAVRIVSIQADGSDDENTSLLATRMA